MTLDELNRFRTLRTLIEHEREKLAELRASTLPHSPRLSDMPKAPGVRDPIGDTVLKIVDLEAEIIEHLEQYRQEWGEVHAWIESVEDLRIKLILVLRFEDGCDWETVADRIGGRETGPAVKKAVSRYLRKGL